MANLKLECNEKVDSIVVDVLVSHPEEGGGVGEGNVLHVLLLCPFVTGGRSLIFYIDLLLRVHYNC